MNVKKRSWSCGDLVPNDYSSSASFTLCMATCEYLVDSSGPILAPLDLIKISENNTSAPTTPVHAELVYESANKTARAVTKTKIRSSDSISKARSHSATQTQRKDPSYKSHSLTVRTKQTRRSITEKWENKPQISETEKLEDKLEKPKSKTKARKTLDEKISLSLREEAKNEETEFLENNTPNDRSAQQNPNLEKSPSEIPNQKEIGTEWGKEGEEVKIGKSEKEEDSQSN